MKLSIIHNNVVLTSEDVNESIKLFNVFSGLQNDTNSTTPQTKPVSRQKTRLLKNGEMVVNLSPEEKAKMVQLFKAGDNRHRVAKLFNRAWTTVDAVYRSEFAKNNTQPQPRRNNATEEEKSQVLELASRHIPYKEIARSTGMNRWSVAEIVKRTEAKV